MSLFKVMRKIKNLQSRILIPYIFALATLQVIVFSLLTWTVNKISDYYLLDELRTISRSFENLLHDRAQNLEALVLPTFAKIHKSQLLKTPQEFARKWNVSSVQWRDQLEPSQNKKSEWHSELTIEDSKLIQYVNIPWQSASSSGWLRLGLELTKEQLADFAKRSQSKIAILNSSNPQPIIAAQLSTLGPQEQDPLERYLVKDWRPGKISEIKLDQVDFALLLEENYISPKVNFNVHVLYLKSDSQAQVITKMAYFVLTLVSIVSLVAFVSIGFAVASSVAMPIQQLMADALMIAAGKLDVYINVDSDDEIGRLSQSLQTMTTKLKQQMAQLKVANDGLRKSNADTMLINLELDRKLFETSLLLGITKAITRSNDSEELLDRILDKIMMSYSIDRGSIMLLDEAHGELVIKLTKKIIPGKNKIVTVEQTTDPRLKIGESILGQVLQTGDPVFLANIPRTETFMRYEHWRDEAIHSMVSIPLKRGDTVIGVMNLIQEAGSGTLKESDLEFLNTLATNISMIVENTELYRASVTDGMTGLFNKRYFTTRLASELDAAKEANTKVGLFFIDIDYFKNLNDSFGHLVGDQILIQVAQKMQANGRRFDIRARYGGEEFAVILPDIDESKLIPLAEELRRDIESMTIKTEKGDAHMTVSIGVALAPDQAKDTAELIERADQALYMAKRNGRNQVQMSKWVAPHDAMTKAS